MTVEQITAMTGLLGAVGGLIWPLVAVGVLVAFRGPAMRALNRVSDDGGTIEVFGVKVNVGKATEEQQRLIEDVQKQVASLREAVRLLGEIAPPRDAGRELARESGFLDPSTRAPRPPAPPPIDDPFLPMSVPVAVASPSPVATPPPPTVASSGAGWGAMFGAAPAGSAAPTSGGSADRPAPRPAAPRLLWVDDHPENNAVLIASLRSRGFSVTETTDTDAGIDAFSAGDFDAVVSDMGRASPTAGIDLATKLRARDGAVPLMIFCSERAARAHGARAKAAGATMVTSSATLLMAALLDLQGPTV